MPPVQLLIESSHEDSFGGPSQHHLSSASLPEPRLPGYLAHLGESGPSRSVPGSKARRAEKGSWEAPDAARAAQGLSARSRDSESSP